MSDTFLAAPLLKMSVSLRDVPGDVHAGEVHYAVRGGEGELTLNAVLGQRLVVRATGLKSCVVCGRGVKKFYGQGLCFPCFRDAPEASPCIIRPELCRAHLGEGRDVAWEQAHHAQEHIVYLSWTGGLKVGVTRATQVPVRWIDQGAVMAVPIARVPYRQLAGLIEVRLKKVFADKTDRRAMLRPQERVDLAVMEEGRARALRELSLELGAYALEDEPVLHVRYPVLALPPKIASVDLDKEPEVAGTLAAIKGQYLVWADGRVLNVRSHSGFHVEFRVVPQAM